jgi:hypothetical protein
MRKARKQRIGTKGVNDMATLANRTASRERLITTLSHEQPDRIPIDFGGTPTTGVHVSCVAAAVSAFRQKPMSQVIRNQFLYLEGQTI